MGNTKTSWAKTAWNVQKPHVDWTYIYISHIFLCNILHLCEEKTYFSFARFLFYLKKIHQNLREKIYQIAIFRPKLSSLSLEHTRRFPNFCCFACLCDLESNLVKTFCGWLSTHLPTSQNWKKKTLMYTIYEEDWSSYGQVWVTRFLQTNSFCWTTQPLLFNHFRLKNTIDLFFCDTIFFKFFNFLLWFYLPKNDEKLFFSWEGDAIFLSSSL
jgi:hypothetical protein